VLDNAAENVSDVTQPGQANAMAAQAMNDAGNAQTAPPPRLQ
jgi:hypothetical protein